MKEIKLLSGGTIEGLFNDTVIGDVVHGIKIERGTTI